MKRGVLFIGVLVLLITVFVLGYMALSGGSDASSAVVYSGPVQYTGQLPDSIYVCDADGNVGSATNSYIQPNIMIIPDSVRKVQLFDSGYWLFTEVDPSGQPHYYCFADSASYVRLGAQPAPAAGADPNAGNNPPASNPTPAPEPNAVASNGAQQSSNFITTSGSNVFPIKVSLIGSLAFFQFCATIYILMLVLVSIAEYEFGNPADSKKGKNLKITKLLISLGLNVVILSSLGYFLPWQKLGTFYGVTIYHSFSGIWQGIVSGLCGIILVANLIIYYMMGRESAMPKTTDESKMQRHWFINADGQQITDAAMVPGTENFKQFLEQIEAGRIFSPHYSRATRSFTFQAGENSGKPGLFALKVDTYMTKPELNSLMIAYQIFRFAFLLFGILFGIVRIEGLPSIYTMENLIQVPFFFIIFGIDFLIQLTMWVKEISREGDFQSTGKAIMFLVVFLIAAPVLPFGLMQIILIVFLSFSRGIRNTMTQGWSDLIVAFTGIQLYVIGLLGIRALLFKGLLWITFEAAIRGGTIQYFYMNVPELLQQFVVFIQ